MKLLKRIVLLASVVGLPFLVALAGHATGALPVSATVINTCKVSSGNAMAFGNYDPMASSDNTAMGTFTMHCTSGTNATILLDQGAHAVKGSLTREMANGGDLLRYQLYTTSSGSTVWDSKSGVSQVANGTAQTITVYGKIPRGQVVAPGTYADTVVITLSY